MDELGADPRAAEVAAACANRGLDGAQPALRRVCGLRGKGAREPRLAAMDALWTIGGWDQAFDITVDALDDPDHLVARHASDQLERHASSETVQALIEWLQTKMVKPRKLHRAELTATVIRTCMRIGDADTRAFLLETSDEWALVPIEATALLTTDRLGLQPAVLDFLDNEEQPRALNRVWAGICTVGAST